jgi:hypothetical protein
MSEDSKSQVRVASVKPAGEYALRIQWVNGKELPVDLRDIVHRLKGLRALRDRAVFARACVGEGGHSVAWPGDLDIGATRLLELGLEQGGRADAVEFIRWRWRNGLSLTGAAEALGLSRRQVAYYVGGEHEVPRYILLACRGWEAERHAAASELGICEEV